MILTIPVSSADYKLLPTLSKILAHFGPYAGYKVVVVPTIEVEQETKRFVAEITPLFSSVETHVVTLNITGWPLASGRHFREVANYVSGKYPHDAWYFFEVDNTPIAPDWLVKLDRAFLSSGKAFMGKVVPTRGWTWTQEGKRVPQMGEPHMVGTGIYHPSFAKKSVKLQTVDRVMPWAEGIEPFDLALRHEIVPFAHNTELIQHNWQTEKYRMEADKMVCGDTAFVTEGTSHAEPWDGESIVIHGCKDGSLANLILSGEFKPKYGQLSLPVTPVFSQTLPGVDQASGEKPPLLSFLAVRVKQAVDSAAPRKLKAKEIAEQVQSTTEEVVKAINEVGSGLKVAGIPKWVSLS
jgi:hypothetical protein